jgi:hypothetical protein
MKDPLSFYGPIGDVVGGGSERSLAYYTGVDCTHHVDRCSV